MTAVKIVDLNNAKADVDHVAAFATSPAPTATDRKGNVKKTIAGIIDWATTAINAAIYSLATVNDRGAWVAGRAYAVKDLVQQGGTWYIAVLPHTSAAAFATDQSSKWRVYQGVVQSEVPYTLPTYSALRGYTGDASAVNISGYLVTAAPSATAGLFTRDDNDTTSADNGGTIIVSGNGKRWKRVYSGSVDAAWFGAKGDGNTSDTIAIQTALNFVAATGGGEVKLGRGTFMAAGLVVSANSVRLTGSGRGATTLKLNANADLLTFSSAAGSIQQCGVADLTMNPNGYSRSAIVFTGSNPNDWHLFARLKIGVSPVANTGFHRAIRIEGRAIWCNFADIDIIADRDSGFWCETTESVNLNTFLNVRSAYCQHHGFYFKNPNAGDYFHSNNFYACNSEANGLDVAGVKNSGFYFYNVGETVLVGCYVEDNGVDSADNLSAALRTEGTFGGVSVTGGLYWGSDYGMKLDAGLAWGTFGGFRSSGAVRNVDCNPTNPDSVMTFTGHYGGAVVSTQNVNADDFAGTLIPFKQPLSSETLAAQDLTRKSVLRYTNSVPVTIGAAGLSNANPGHILWIVNDGGSTVTLTHEANLLVPGSASLVIGSGQSAMMLKVSPTAWRVLWWSGRLSSPYTVTNPATSRSFDASTATAAQLAAVLGTLIADLKAANVIR